LKQKNNILFLFLGIVFLTILPTNLFAQNKDFRRLTISDGLSHDNVYTIIQDQTGFMWLGTQNGLDKYNGYSFTSFFHDPQDSCSLVSANFGKLMEDSKGRIWLCTYRGGLSCFTPSENKIVHFSHDEIDSKSLSSNLVRDIAEDVNGGIWVATSRGGLHLFSEDEMNFTRFHHAENNDNTIADNDAITVVADKKGFVWVGTSNGLSRVDINTLKINTYRYEAGNPLSLGLSSIQSLFVDSNNTLWVGTKGAGAYKFTPSDDSFLPLSALAETPIDLDKTRIQSITQSADGRVWFGTYTKGLVSYDLKIHKLESYVNDPDDLKSLGHNKVETIFEDRAGNLWVGTRGGGVSILDLKPQKFKNQGFDVKKEKQLAGEHVSCFSRSTDEDKIWIGTNSGLSFWDMKKKESENFFHDKTNSNSLPGSRIRSLLFSKDSVLWIGTYASGISRMKNDGDKIEFTNFSSKTHPNITGDQINSLIQDKNGVIWVGTNFGVSRITLDENGTPSFEAFDDKKYKLLQKYILCLFEDSNNNMWVGTPFGLYKYLPQTESFKLFVNISSSAKDIDINNINKIFEDSQQQIWIGTGGGGLFRFEPKDGTFEKFRDNGFKTGNVEGILEAEKDVLWISTGKGLSRLEVKERKFHHFGISDGLSETGFNVNACMKLSDEEIIFGSITGFTTLNPKKIGFNSSKPNIILTDFKVFNKSIFKDQNSFCQDRPATLDEIVLTHDDYVFSFEFAALDFTFPSENKYRYKMEGFDKDWIEFGNKRYAMFTSLPPGTYTFKAQGTNNDGLWCSEEQSLSIKVVVKPAFWQTKLFYAGVATILLVIIGLFIKLRLSKLKREKANLEKRVEIRTAVVEKQKEVLRANSEEMKEQNEKIKSSIRYAKTIQNAILPFPWRFDSFAESFIIYKPKDIVSGDFYWYEHIGGYRFIAAVDCSGHGVPGAFMSMIGSRLLKEIVTEKNIFDPSEILTKLDQYVKKTLKQDQTDNRDGMDVCLLRIDEKSEDGINAVFCGAKRDLIYFKDEEKKIYRHKGTRRSIGGVFSRKSNQVFENVELNFSKDDIVYLATDGFIDQSNPERKRYGTHKLIPLLEEISPLNVDQIKGSLLESLEKFQETSSQRDDITLIGLRLK